MQSFSFYKLLTNSLIKPKEIRARFKGLVLTLLYNSSQKSNY